MVTFEEYPGDIASTEWCSFGCPRVVHVISLLHELHCVPVCFWIKFKVLSIFFKALHGMGTRLPKELSHLYFINPSPPYLVCVFYGLHQLKKIRLADCRKRVFSAGAPTLWNILPMEMRKAPTHLAIQTSFNTWRFPLAWRSKSSIEPWKWLMVWRHTLHLLNFLF